MMGFSAHVIYHGLKSIANPIKLVSISPPTHSTHPFLYPLSSLASYLYLFFPHIHQISLSTNSASTTPFLSTSPIYSFSPSIFSLHFSLPTTPLSSLSYASTPFHPLLYSTHMFHFTPTPPLPINPIPYYTHAPL